jgi:hypothetical protein
MPCVYIFSNPSFHGLYKIGYTSSSASERAIELHTTGVPTPFKVEREWHFVTVEEARNAESFIHDYYSGTRHAINREFFKVSISELDQLIKTKYPEVFEDLLKRKEKQRVKEVQERNLHEDRKKQYVENQNQIEVSKLMPEWNRLTAYIRDGYPNLEYRSTASELLIQTHKERLQLAKRLYQLGAKETGIITDFDLDRFYKDTALAIERLKRIIEETKEKDRDLIEKRNYWEKVGTFFMCIGFIILFYYAMKHF